LDRAGVGSRRVGSTGRPRSDRTASLASLAHGIGPTPRALSHRRAHAQEKQTPPTEGIRLPHPDAGEAKDMPALFPAELLIGRPLRAATIGGRFAVLKPGDRQCHHIGGRRRRPRRREPPPCTGRPDQRRRQPREHRIWSAQRNDRAMPDRGFSCGTTSATDWISFGADTEPIGVGYLAAQISSVARLRLLYRVDLSDRPGDNQTASTPRCSPSRRVGSGSIGRDSGRTHSHSRRAAS
jgi:hypothetical protein